jgi:beta-carotene ketolase (CrtW type)
MRIENKTNPWKGLAIAVLVIAVWGASLYVLLSLKFSKFTFYLLPLAVLWQTFLYTGLFITAHDAMHGTVLPGNKKANKFIGSLAVKLYALFSYSRLLEKHWAHHRNPASDDDPDFHDGENAGFLKWYYHFLRGYITRNQVFGMAVVFVLLKFMLGIPVPNLLLLWIFPSLLSTVQLFYFGTYLPHRETEDGYSDRHHARSNEFSTTWSFFTCYHFGFHWEHHEFPYVPWWRLPEVRRQIKMNSELCKYQN